MGVARQAVVILEGADRPGVLQGIGPFKNKGEADEWVKASGSNITAKHQWTVELGNPEEITAAWQVKE